VKFKKFNLNFKVPRNNAVNVRVPASKLLRILNELNHKTTIMLP